MPRNFSHFSISLSWIVPFSPRALQILFQAFASTVSISSGLTAHAHKTEEQSTTGYIGLPSRVGAQNIFVSSHEP